MIENMIILKGIDCNKINSFLMIGHKFGELVGNVEKGTAETSLLDFGLEFLVRLM